MATCLDQSLCIPKEVVFKGLKSREGILPLLWDDSPLMLFNVIKTLLTWKLEGLSSNNILTSWIVCLLLEKHGKGRYKLAFS